MATAKQRLEYEVRLKDLASQALRNMGDNAKKQTTRASKAFKALSKAIKMVGLAVVAAFTAATFKGLMEGTKRVRELGSAMAEINTIMSAGGLSIGDLTERVNRLAIQLGIPAPELAAGMYQTLSAGITDSAQAMTMLKGAGKLGVAGLSTTKEAVDLLTTSFNAYGSEVSESAVTAMSDLAFTTVRVAKTTIPELSASMGQVLPMASTLGVSIEDVAGALSVLTASGVQTSEAVTQIVGVMTAFLNAGDKYGDLMGSAAFESQGFQEAITRLMDATGGNADKLKEMMGRAEGVKAVLKLTSNEGEELTGKLEELGKKAGSSDQAFDIMAETMDRKVRAAQEGIRQGFADIIKSIAEFHTASMTFEDVTEQAEAFKSALQGLVPIVNMIGLVVGTVMTGILTVFTAVQGAIYLIALAMNQLGLVADETFDNIEESSAGMVTALAGSAEMTQNFGRQLIGLESNGYKATKAMAALHGEIKDGHSGLTSFNAAVDEQGALFVDAMRDVKNGLVAEEEVMERIKKGYDYFVDKSEELNVELPEQVKSWGEVLDRGKLFKVVVEESSEAVEDLASEVEVLAQTISTIPGLYSKEFRKAVSDSTTLMQHEHGVRMMLMRDGEEKEIASLKHRAEMESRATHARISGLELEEEEFFAMMTIFDEAREAQLGREIAALKAANKEKAREARLGAVRAAREEQKAWNEMTPEVREAILNPVKALQTLGVQMVEDAAVKMREKFADKFGTDLAGELGGPLGGLGGFFEMTPVFNLNNLKTQVHEAKIQILDAFEAGKIDADQMMGMKDMILNIEHFKIKELEAAAATYEFKRSLEDLGPAQAGVRLGLKNFTDGIPELGEAIADVTEGSMKAFASGLTSAMMAFADGSKSASEAFKEFAKQFIMQVAAMIVQMLILQGLKLAFGGFADGGVAEGGVELLAGGGVVTGGLGRALPVKGYASGGPIVSEPHLALVGEGSMNEAVVPLPDGRSIPVDMQGGGGASVAFTINAVDARGVDELLVERQDTIRNLIRQAMTEDRVFRQTMKGG